MQNQLLRDHLFFKKVSFKIMVKPFPPAITDQSEKLGSSLLYPYYDSVLRFGLFPDLRTIKQILLNFDKNYR